MAGPDPPPYREAV